MKAACLFIILLLLCLTPGFAVKTITDEHVLKGHVICLDPGHGGTSEKDSYRVGPSGEREEWINLRVALILKDMLEKAGAQVIMTRTQDVNVGLKERAQMAIDGGAELFISIHHNKTTADEKINYSLLFFHGKASENPATIDLAEYLLRHFLRNPHMEEGALFSDHLIFADSGFGVLRAAYPVMPAVIGEFSFFGHPEEEQRLKSWDYNVEEAKLYFAALEEYYRHGLPSVVVLDPANGQQLAASPPGKAPAIKEFPGLRLDDGQGSHYFIPDTLKLELNGEEVEVEYEEETGMVKPKEKIELPSGKHWLQVWGKNFGYNRIHPRKFFFEIK